MNRLKYYREKEDISQCELARRTGIDQGAISRTESGIRDLAGQEWKLVAEVLGCSVDELLGNKKE